MLRVTATQIQTYAGGSASIPAWTDNSDTTTGLFYPATNTVAFSTGGTEALRITGGNVGIGTTSPTVNLNVWGVRAAQKTLLQLETDSSGGATNDENSIDFKYYNGYEQGRISSYVYNNATGNGGLKFYTSLTGTSYNSTPNMTLDPNGNVGIGTTGPRYKNTTIGVISSLLSDDGTNYEGLTITPATGYSTISTVTGGSGTANLNINLVTSGTGGVGINALSGSLPNHKPQLYVYKNANTSNIVTVANVASGSAAYSGIYASVDSTLTNAAGLLALSAGYTTSGMFVANTGAIYSSMPGGLNIGSYANTQVSIWTNNLQRLTVLNDGNVGIGTTGPTSKLSVVGDVDITGSYLINGSPFSGSSQWVTTGSNIYYTTGNVGIGTTNPGSKLAVSVPGAVAGDVDPIITGQYSDINFGLYSVATAITDPKAFGLALKTYKQNIGLYEAIRITHDGNVGIGTTTPGANLEVVDTVRVGSDGDIGADTEFANLDFYSNDLSTGAQKTAGAIRLKSGSTNWQSSASPAYHDASMLFYTISDGTFSEKLRIQDVGNVGIGTTIPSSRLEIKESTAGSLPVLRLIASDDGLVSVVGKDAQEDFYLYGYDGTGNVDIQFRAGGDVSYINSGNVGIGTTGPSSYLAGVFGLSVYGATNSGVSVATSNGYWMWYMPNGGTDLRLYNGVGGDRLTVLSSGNVGIGTTNPSSFQLQITGNGGKPGGGSWGDTSDARLKTDVVSITNALDKITQLNPVHFTWINPSEHGNMYGIQGGFIAQELESVFPQWVKEGTPSGLDNLLVNGDIVKTINLPFEFDAYVVAAIQELNNQLNIYIDENQVLRIKDQGEGVGIIVSNIKSIASISGKWSIDEGGNVIAKTVTVEEGFNMKDQVTGQYYCVTLRNGEFDKQPGKCGEAVAPTAPTEEAVPEEVGGSTVETTEQTTQEPVEEIIESQPEAVVESEETSSEEVIVETTEEEVLPAGAETQEPTEGESEGTTLE
jgi:hypothetical protein